ncbi:MAG TPA: nuclear transport factor 2 family protein, partial [Acidimicrobiales bacterium]
PGPPDPSALEAHIDEEVQMPVIDPDPNMLKASADSAKHATEETWRHIDAEVVAADGDYVKLMTTLMDEGPWGYTIQPRIHGDGTVRAIIINTWDEIREAYEEVRGRSDLLRSESLIELRGTWYVFNESISYGHVKTEPEPSPGTHLLGLFPVSSKKGISGELVFPLLPKDFYGRGDVPADIPTDRLELREWILKLNERYLDAFRAGDVDGMLDTFNDDVAGGVRDYVNDTGALIELHGKDAARAHYTDFVAKYEINSVDLFDRVIQPEYVFFELRITATPRDGGPTVAFHTAQFDVLAKDNRSFVRIGHGTDPTTVV